MASITLNEQVYPVRRVLTGSDCLEAVQNTVIKFKVGNSEILDQKVPVGKVWRITVTAKIEETDA